MICPAFDFLQLRLIWEKSAVVNKIFFLFNKEIKFDAVKLEKGHFRMETSYKLPYCLPSATA